MSGSGSSIHSKDGFMNGFSLFSGFRCRHAAAVFFIISLSLVPGFPLHAADFSLRPSISVSEEYTTRINERDDVAESDWISRLQPGFVFRYAAPRWTWDVGYTLDYRWYARTTPHSETFHNASLTGKVEAIKNFFYIDLSDTYKLTPIDIARNAADESLSSGQVKTNTAGVKAYFLLRPIEHGTITTGYRFNDVRYFDGPGIDKSEHGGFIDFVYELSPRFRLTSGYAASHNSTSVNNIIKHEAYGGFIYDYAEKSSLYGQLGNTWMSLSPGEKLSDPLWRLGLTHSFDKTLVTLEVGVTYPEDPLSASTRTVAYSGKIVRTLQRGSVTGTINYIEYYPSTPGVRDSSKTTAGITGTLDIAERLAATMNLSAEHYLHDTTVDYPYRLLASPGLRKNFNNDLSLSLNYYYISYRDGLTDTRESRDTHRVILELRKLF